METPEKEIEQLERILEIQEQGVKELRLIIKKRKQEENRKEKRFASKESYGIVINSRKLYYDE